VKWPLTADSHISCRSPSTTLPFSDANSHTIPFPCRFHDVPLPRPCRGLESSLSERHIRGMAGERDGNGKACVNQTRSHCVNQMGKTQTKPLAERHGNGMVCVNPPLTQQTIRPLNISSTVLLLTQLQNQDITKVERQVKKKTAYHTWIQRVIIAEFVAVTNTESRFCSHSGA
jgi:hypothetical protein